MYNIMDNLTIDTTSNIDEYESEMNKKCFTYLIEQQTNKITTNMDIMNNHYQYSTHNK